MPDEVTFATKSQLAAAMLQRACKLGLPVRWFASDEVYASLELRRTARTLGFGYALAMPQPLAFLVGGPGRRQVQLSVDACVTVHGA